MQITNSTPAFKGAFYVSIHRCKTGTPAEAAKKTYQILDEAKTDKDFIYTRVFQKPASDEKGSFKETLERPSFDENCKPFSIKAIVPDDEDSKVLDKLKKVSKYVVWTNDINDNTEHKVLEFENFPKSHVN